MRIKEGGRGGPRRHRHGSGCGVSKIKSTGWALGTMDLSFDSGVSPSSSQVSLWVGSAQEDFPQPLEYSSPSLLEVFTIRNYSGPRKMTDCSNCWKRCGEKGTLAHWWVSESNLTRQVFSPAMKMLLGTSTSPSGVPGSISDPCFLPGSALGCVRWCFPKYPEMERLQLMVGVCF